MHIQTYSLKQPRKKTPTFDVGPSVLLCCWSSDLKLIARQSTRPGVFSGLLSEPSQNFSVLILLAYTMH